MKTHEFEIKCYICNMTQSLLSLKEESFQYLNRSSICNHYNYNIEEYERKIYSHLSRININLLNNKIYKIIYYNNMNEIRIEKSDKEYFEFKLKIEKTIDIKNIIRYIDIL